MVGLDGIGAYMIYPTIAGGDTFFWDKSKDPNKDSRLKEGGSVNKMVKTSSGRWKFDDASKSRLTILPADGYVLAKKECDMDFADALARGYAGKATEWGSVELTVAFKVTDAPGGNDVDLHVGGPTGEHPSNSTPCCMGCSYKSHIELNRTPMSFYVAKEMYHVNNAPHRPNPYVQRGSFGGAFNRAVVDLENHPSENSHDGVMLYKYVVFLNQGAQKNFVKLQQFACPSGNRDDPAYWKLVNETIDAGKWGKGGGKCGGADDQILNWRQGRLRIRLDSDGSDLELDSISARALSPDIITQPPDTNPPPPTGSRFKRIFTYKYHLAGFGRLLCGFTQPPTSFTTLYNVPDAGDWDELTEGKFRIAIYCANSQSDLIGHKINQATFWLERVGSPPSGNLEVNIRRGTDDSVAVNLPWISGTLDAATIATSKTAYVFENLTHNYFLQVGDKISVEYDKATTGNKIKVYEDEGGPFDGANTCQIYFDGGNPPVNWKTIRTGQDTAAILYENTA